MFITAILKTSLSSNQQLPTPHQPLPLPRLCFSGCPGYLHPSQYWTPPYHLRVRPAVWAFFHKQPPSSGEAFLRPLDQRPENWDTPFQEVCFANQEVASTRSLLEDPWTWCFPLCFRDWRRRSLLLWFDLSHSRAGISSMFARVPLSLTQTHVTGTQMFYLFNTQG